MCIETYWRGCNDIYNANPEKSLLLLLAWLAASPKIASLLQAIKIARLSFLFPSKLSPSLALSCLVFSCLVFSCLVFSCLLSLGCMYWEQGCLLLRFPSVVEPFVHLHVVDGLDHCCLHRCHFPRSQPDLKDREFMRMENRCLQHLC